jgi:hypothetical protein
LNGTCWEQRKTTSDSALEISGFRVSPALVQMQPDESSGWRWRQNCQDEKCTTGGGGVVGESWVNGRMREVERLGPFRILQRDWDLGYICRLWSFTMVSCMLLSHGSQAVQTSKVFSGQGPDEYMRNVIHREVLEM